MRTIFLEAQLESDVDVLLSNQLNMDRVGINDEWLHQQIQNGYIPLRNVLELQQMRDLCQFHYPDLWDIQVEVTNININAITKNVDTEELVLAQPYGANFEMEPGGPFDRTDYATAVARRHNRRLRRISDEQGEINSTLVGVFPQYKFHIIIKFPEFIISNSNGESLTIRDLYYKFDYGPIEYGFSFRSEDDNDEYFSRDCYHSPTSHGAIKEFAHGIKVWNKNYLFGTKINAMRTSVTSQEFNARYAHSHARSRSGIPAYMEWGNCCLGSGEIIETLVALNMDASDQRFTPTTFEMALLQLDAYARWESLEGGPHVRMSTIGRGSILGKTPPTIDQSVVDTHWARLQKLIKGVYNPPSNPDALQREFTIKPLDYTIENGKISVVMNDKLEEFCKMYDENTRLGSYMPDTIFKKDEEGNYYLPNFVSNGFALSSAQQRERTNHWKIFKGEQIYFTPIGEMAQSNVEPRLFIHPKIVLFIKSQIEANANYNKIKSDTTRRAISLVNQPRNF